MNLFVLAIMIKPFRNSTFNAFVDAKLKGLKYYHFSRPFHVVFMAQVPPHSFYNVYAENISLWLLLQFNPENRYVLSPYVLEVLVRHTTSSLPQLSPFIPGSKGTWNSWKSSPPHHFNTFPIQSHSSLKR